MWMDRTEMVVRSDGRTGCIDVDVDMDMDMDMGMDMDMCAHVHANEYMGLYMRLIVHLAMRYPFTLCSLARSLLSGSAGV